ncbi:MAG: C39 family peptidase [Spirochaetes bacterium]|nr:C39 family peptidase [Spirochaetota bacterium]
MKHKLSMAIAAALILIAGMLAGHLLLPRLCRGGDPWRAVRVLPVPDVRQSTTYSCGAAALQAVLMYWGVEKREGDLMKMLGSSETSGTGPERIAAVAKQLGMKAAVRENLSIVDLRHSIERGVPVIVAIQAWVDPAPRGFCWRDDWEDGHYVVVTGLDERNVYVEDPSLLGTGGYIPLGEFADRWHDYSGEPPLDGSDRKWIGLGIFISGQRAKIRERFTHVD